METPLEVALRERREAIDRAEAAEQEASEVREILEKRAYQAALEQLRALAALRRRAEAAEQERDMLHDVVLETARELGCEPDNESLLERADALAAEVARLRGALRVIRSKTGGFCAGSWESQLHAVAVAALRETPHD